MALPKGVALKAQGTAEFVTQRGYWTPPFKSCMFAALCSVLEWIGYDVPLVRTQPIANAPDNFVHLLHVNSGASLEHGTTTAHTKKALEVTFGADNIPLVKYGLIPEPVFLEQLAGNWAARVGVNMGKMPRHLRRWCGYGFTGAHAVALLDARVNAGKQEVFLCDPMGRPSVYGGEWVTWDSIRSAVNHTGDSVQATIGEWNTAYDVAPKPPIEPPLPPEESMPMIVGGVKDEFVSMPKGTPLYRPDTLQLVTRSFKTELRVVGKTEDGKYLAVQARTLRLPGKGLVVLLADSLKAGTPYVKPQVDKTVLDEVQAELDTCSALQAEDAAASDKLAEVDALIHA